MGVVLVGGGPDTTRSATCVEPFIEECRRRSASRVGLLLAGDRTSADHFAAAYLALLGELAGTVEVVPLDDGVSDVTRFDAVVVGGGPTPEYHDRLAAALRAIGEMVAGGAPYLGFSAGAMIAAETAVIGGHLSAGVEVCPAEWSEGLAEVTLRPGIGVVTWAVEVHAAQAGTLGRAIDAVASGAVGSAVALDEDTALHVDAAGVPRVLGSGRAWWVTRDDDGAGGGADGGGGVRVRPTSPS